jgi:hypothetical protein
MQSKEERSNCCCDGQAANPVIFFDVNSTFLPARASFLLPKRAWLENEYKSYAFDPVCVSIFRRLTELSLSKIIPVGNRAESKHVIEWLTQELETCGWDSSTFWHQDQIVRHRSDMDRGIADWLYNHPDVRRWVVFSSARAPRPGWIAVDRDVGLTIKDYRRALMQLDAEDFVGFGIGGGWPSWTFSSDRNAIRLWLNRVYAPALDDEQEADLAKAAWLALNDEDPWEHPGGPKQFELLYRKQCFGSSKSDKAAPTTK